MRSIIICLLLVTSNLFAFQAPFALQSDYAADLSDAVIGGLYRHRLGYERCPCERSVWLQGFGSYRNRSSHNNRARYEEYFGGLIGGVNYALSCQSEVNFFLGGSWGGVNIHDQTPHYKTDSFFGGMTLENICECSFWGFTLAGGVLHSDRTVRFPIDVREDAQGVFLCPDLTYAYQWCNLPCNPITSLSLRYAGWFINDYQVREVLGTFYVRDRAVQLITLRGELAAPICWPNCWNFQPYFALAGRFQFDGNHVRGRIVATHLRFSDGLDNTIGQAIIGGRVSKRFGKYDFQANLEGMFDSDSSARVLGEVTFNYNF